MNRASTPKQIMTLGGKKMAKPGLYASINAKQKRIAAGSDEKMRKPGTGSRPRRPKERSNQ
jgi:hypothetical protein